MPLDLPVKARLDLLYRTYGSGHLASDPIQFPRRFVRDDDREVAGFIAAALAYGRVAHIRQSVETVLGLLGGSPAGTLRALDLAAARRSLVRFTHRFNTGGDVARMLVILARLREEHGSLNAAFLAGYDAERPDVGHAIASFSKRALALDPARRRAAGRAGVRFFFSSPEDGSACKRLNMFLRWMVRKDDVDLGVWRGIAPSRLVMPLDTHTARICRSLGFSARRSADWRMALEVTAALRALDPDDPVRYDFALFNWGLETAGGRGAA